MVVDPASSQPWCRNREIVRGQGTVAAMPSRSSKAARPRDEPKATNLSTGVRETSRRPLRIFPFDPMFDRFHDPIISRVPYEVVTPGRRVGSSRSSISIRVPGNGMPPLDLNSPEVLITQGFSPSERDLRSHQQMVYAVAMRVLEAFERGLGRPFDWLERLKLLPHASKRPTPTSRTIIRSHFGYFTAEQPDPIAATCRVSASSPRSSYDVVAHEMCHPVMWRLRPTD